MEEQVCWNFDSETSVFERERHIFYMEMMYQLLSSAYQDQEINRLTLAYFVVSGLDILSALDRIDKEVLINWVLSLQAPPKNETLLGNGMDFFMDSMVPEAPNFSQLITGQSEGEGDGKLAVEIMDFMAKSKKPTMSPTKELMRGGIMDSGREIGADEDSGIECILSGLQK